MTKGKRSYVGLVIFGVPIVGILLVILMFVFAVHNGGAKASTIILLPGILSEDQSSEFDNYMRSRLSAKCRKEPTDEPCTHWFFTDPVNARTDTYDGTTWIIINSTPRYKFLFGSATFRASHVEVEAGIMSYFDDVAFSVERQMR
ncbi:hypothetical protein [Aliiroseovarius sp. PrR006]|uniref:hypothetical protein n=1 Tax=Aliiroseovarius sp. PrR006 TaxID=2706883 RepID=UPI0013D19F61|nr:hypothetical protein [Aliiroseovarius sp. PrR006]NDW54066.1 hypothetical protein [Aliiroseovarius sp. PrR006]